MIKLRKKTWRTTIIGILGFLILFVTLLFVYLGKATLSEAGTYGGMIAMILASLSALFSKDEKDKSLDNTTAEKAKEFFENK